MPAYLTYFDGDKKILSKHKFPEWCDACLVAQRCKIDGVKRVSVESDTWAEHHIEAERMENGYLDWFRVPHQTK